MLNHLYSGKVRELYQADDGVLLLVASDRMSAFDYVLETPIPDKGKILTQLSLWWFERLADLVPNHVVDAPIPPEFAGRAMACKPLRMVPAECVARGYLTGSALAEYQRNGMVCGISLPGGLDDGSPLPEPIFTPATQGTARRARREHHLRPADRVGRRTTSRRNCGGSRSPSTSAAHRSRPSAESSSPTPRSSLALTPTARSRSATRCLLLTRRGSGPPTSGSQDAASRPSTSSTCGTGCSHPNPAGTGALASRHRRFRTV